MAKLKILDEDRDHNIMCAHIQIIKSKQEYSSFEN